MARKCLTHPYINVSLGSVDSNGVASSVPHFSPGETVRCDSGVYIYMQANGAVAEGYAVKFVERTWDADTVTTSESGSTNTPIAICVTSGGLSDNQWGWFWRGEGSEYVYLTTTISADVQLTTHSSAGQVSTGGDNLKSLFSNASSGSGGLTVCRAAGLLETNFTTAAS